MKKCALLMLLVLGVATVASANPWAQVGVKPVVSACENVCVTVTACIPGTFKCPPKVEWCVRGGIVLIDIYLERTDKCKDALCLKQEVNIKKLCPGTYSVIARVYVKDVAPCSPFTLHRVSAMGSAWFKVVPSDPYCPPWPWWFF